MKFRRRNLRSICWRGWVIAGELEKLKDVLSVLTRAMRGR